MEEGPQRRHALLSLATIALAGTAIVGSAWGWQTFESAASLFGPPRLTLSRAERAPAAPQRLPAVDAPPRPQRLPPIESAVSRLPRVAPRIVIEDPAQTAPRASAPAVHLPNAVPTSPALLPPPLLSSDASPKTRPATRQPTASAPVLPRRRIPRIDGISQRAAALSRRAYQLADRGALYSARSDFIQALRMVTQALDAQADAFDPGRSTLLHGRALAAGLLAMKEADDFVPRGASLEADLDVPAIIAGHRTPILKQNASEVRTPLAAMQQYFAFAQQQLALAGGSQQAASMALHGLGKVQSAIAAGDRSQLAATGAKAIVFQRAALSVDRRNYPAANELGVLLARYGQWAEARQVLLHSISLAPSATNWHNLAVVHGKLNETDLALRAEHESKLAARQAAPSGTTGSSSGGRAVRWVSPRAFAGGRPVETRESPAPVAAKQDQRHAKWWESLNPWN